MLSSSKCEKCGPTSHRELRSGRPSDASGFARDLVVQELGIALLARRGVRLMTATGEDLTD
jgi:hypothetical protein